MLEIKIRDTEGLISNLHAKLKHKTEYEDIADCAGLTGIFAAQNRANGGITARICASTDGKE